jgi:hypothetical protein
MIAARYALGGEGRITNGAAESLSHGKLDLTAAPHSPGRGAYIIHGPIMSRTPRARRVKKPRSFAAGMQAADQLGDVGTSLPVKPLTMLRTLASLVRLRLGLHHGCCNAATNGDNKRDRNKGNPHSTLLSSASTKPVAKRGSSRLVPAVGQAFKKIRRPLVSPNLLFFLANGTNPLRRRARQARCDTLAAPWPRIGQDGPVTARPG